MHWNMWDAMKLEKRLKMFIGGQCELHIKPKKNKTSPTEIYRGQVQSVKVDGHEVLNTFDWLCIMRLGMDGDNKPRINWELVPNSWGYTLPFEYKYFYPQGKKKRVKLKTSFFKQVKMSDEIGHFYLPSDPTNLVEINGEYKQLVSSIIT